MIISPESKNQMRLVAFRTPSVIDPVGRRFHSEDQNKAFLKRMKKDIPPQD